MNDGLTIKIVVDDSKHIPSYSTEGDCAADLRSTKSMWLYPGIVSLVPTGVQIELPKGYVGLVCPRSGLALDGLTVANAPGIIDGGFRGEVCVLLHNTGKNRLLVNSGERIAQLLVVPYVKANFKPVEELTTTTRGDKGFGSTGVE